MRELRAKLEARAGEVAEMGVKGTELEWNAEKIREDLNCSERKRFEFKIENKELFERNIELQKDLIEV